MAASWFALGQIWQANALAQDAARGFTFPVVIHGLRYTTPVLGKRYMDSGTLEFWFFVSMFVVVVALQLTRGKQSDRN